MTAPDRAWVEARMAEVPPYVQAHVLPWLPDLAAALLAALDRVAEVEAERDALACIVEAADPCVEALRDIAPDAHAVWLDVYDAATLASVTCEVDDE